MKVNIQEQLSKFYIRAEDLEIIKQAAILILPLLPKIIEDYRLWLLASPEMTAIFGGEKGIAENLVLKRKHWTSVWAAEIDDEYLDFRRKMGRLHADLGITLDQYFSIVATFLNFFEQAFKKLNIETYALSNAFNKLINLDISIVLLAYSNAHNETLRSQSEALMSSMSTPIAQLWDSILLLPLVGIVDSRRAQDIMSIMLQRVALTQAKIFILDISGVAVVDTAVANHFIKITKSTRLMGCTTIISGISPAIAQTIVELGIHIDEIKTTGSMQDALRQGFQLTNIAEIK
jgi:rsbT co-antagonist protein RsbR